MNSKIKDNNPNSENMTISFESFKLIIDAFICFRSSENGDRLEGCENFSWIKFSGQSLNNTRRILTPEEKKSLEGFLIKSSKKFVRQVNDSKSTFIDYGSEQKR